MKTGIGISGWQYAPWRNVFYPEKLAQREELHFASRHVSSIEINSSFYSLQKPESYQKWYQETPKGFLFSVKAPRYITHIRRLKECAEPMANFFASGVLHLEEKLGAVLWQLPPSFRYDEERLESFLSLLPKTFKEAVRCADKADRVEPTYPSSAARSSQKIRHALEVRHHSFENPYFIEQLRRHNVALVFADNDGRWPYMEDLTADFVYLRLHGSEELYASGYSDQALKEWSRRLHLWQQGKQPSDALTMHEKAGRSVQRDAFVYFDNDVKVYAPRDAQRLGALFERR